MKVYIAGKLCNEDERKFLEKLAKLAEELGFETFLPHREIGLAKNIYDVEKIFNGDIINGFKDVSLVIADLNGLHIGSGTAWELGYAYAKGIPVIGIKEDEPIENALDSLSAIIIHSTKIVNSLEELKKELERFKINQEA
ncbi:MAG: nucleoside 2-deoxyribosyltransferase [Nanoarchaeota archaeon]|nr:nucleoside 2-deoxyribosyltransferase [Nanoarchaeota archaeon]